ncbi:MAG: GntR family transcriptional regulator [Actinomycetia bacterium]|nr:GntR family transcriptional regulator [Actinomycetes bacterium]
MPENAAAIGTDTTRGLRTYLSSTPSHGSTTDAVTNALREAILDGVLAPATWLREGDLAEQLQVSRTPVREALRRLSDEQLTVRTVNRGTLVASMTIDDILAVYAVRENLDGLAAQMTAQRRPPTVVEALRSINHQMAEAAGLGDTKLLAKLNVDFHGVLRDGSGNPYLVRFLTEVEHAFRRFGHSTYEVPGRPEEALQEHAGIVEAVAAGDPDLASKRAFAHSRRARDVRIQTLLRI